ncbi:hypothetical protein MHYP_G00060260 [Metynnis hypsauchen]
MGILGFSCGRRVAIKTVSKLWVAKALRQTQLRGTSRCRLWEKHRIGKTHLITLDRSAGECFSTPALMWSLAHGCQGACDGRWSKLGPVFLPAYQEVGEFITHPAKDRYNGRFVSSGSIFIQTVWKAKKVSSPSTGIIPEIPHFRSSI